MTGLQKQLIVLAVLGLLVAAVYLPWRSSSRGAPKVAVTGRVLVNGEPAAGLQIRLFGEDTSLARQDQMPVAVTDENGRFELSSFGGNDGAVEGMYTATFFWPTNLLQPDKDRFRDRYSDPAKSKYRVTIPARPVDLPPFELTAPEDQLLPMEMGWEQLKQMAK